MKRTFQLSSMMLLRLSLDWSRAQRVRYSRWLHWEIQLAPSWKPFYQWLRSRRILLNWTSVCALFPLIRPVFQSSSEEYKLLIDFRERAEAIWENVKRRKSPSVSDQTFDELSAYLQKVLHLFNFFRRSNQPDMSSLLRNGHSTFTKR